jgi:leader peptidase (prepilin peptidase)/N-methyltransferase
LLIGSFLNVVIYRLPKMMERQWAAECAELNGQPPPAQEAFNLLDAAFALPVIAATRSAGSRTSPCSATWRCAASARPAARHQPALPAGRAGHRPAVRLVRVALGLGLQRRRLVRVRRRSGGAHPDRLGHHPAARRPDLAAAVAGPDRRHAGLDRRAPGDAVWGAVAGYLSLWLVYWGFKLATGKEGMGFGDFKLFAALGAWFGWQALVPIILMASVIGAVVGIGMKLSSSLREGGVVPFGPFLAMAGMTAMVFGPQTILRVVGL